MAKFSAKSENILFLRCVKVKMPKGRISRYPVFGQPWTRIKKANNAGTGVRRRSPDFVSADIGLK
jgi:hypothetical protein